MPYRPVNLSDIPFFSPRQFNALADGETDDQPYFEDAVAAMGGENRHMHLTPGEYRIKTSITLDENVTLAPEAGAVINLDASKTLTLDGGIIHGPHPLFSGAGTVAFGTSSRVERFYPQWWGAKGDGVTDDSSAIQKAITAASSRGGGIVYFVPGNYYVGAFIRLASNVHLAGSGIQTTRFTSPGGAPDTVFISDGKTNWSMRDFALAPAAAITGINGFGLLVQGSSADILVENVKFDGYVNAIYLDGLHGTTPDYVRRVTMRGVLALNSPNSYGFRSDKVHTSLYDACQARDNAFDGFKLNSNTYNQTFRNCIATGNGAIFLTVAGDPTQWDTNSGDGLDAYAGGDTFTIEGGIYEGNYGNGIQIKTGPAQTAAFIAGHTYIRDISIVGVRCNNNLAGGGLIVVVGTPGDLTEPLVSSVTILGGNFDGNAGYGGTTSNGDGILIDARNVRLVGVHCKGNGRNGILTLARAMDVSIIDPVVLHNSLSAPGNHMGIRIAGSKRVNIRGGLVYGVDADNIKVDSDYAALTKTHQYNIAAESGATDILIEDVTEGYALNTPGISTATTSGIFLLRHRGTGAPEGAYKASIGSTYTQTDGLSDSLLWVKVRGAPNNPAGWGKIQIAKVSTRLSILGGTIAAGDTLYREYTLADATMGDFVDHAPQTEVEEGLNYNIHLIADALIQLRFHNTTASPIVMATRDWDFLIL